VNDHGVALAYPECWAEFGMQRSVSGRFHIVCGLFDRDLPICCVFLSEITEWKRLGQDMDREHPWRTCMLQPTSNLVWATIHLDGGRGDVTLAAHCRMEMETFEQRLERRVKICLELVDGFLVGYLLLLCVASRAAAKVLYNFHRSTTTKTSQDGGESGSEPNDHIQLRVHLGSDEQSSLQSSYPAARP
jgi:hypothetical protein